MAGLLNFQSQFSCQKPLLLAREPGRPTRDIAPNRTGLLISPFYKIEKSITRQLGAAESHRIDEDKKGAPFPERPSLSPSWNYSQIVSSPLSQSFTFSVVTDFGRSSGKPKARLHTRAASTPRPRLTPKSTV